MKLKSVITVTVALCFLVAWVLVKGLSSSLWQPRVPGWVRYAARGAVTLEDMAAMNARAGLLGLHRPFRSGSLVLTRSHTGFGMAQNLGMNSYVSHAGLLMLFPEDPGVPYIYELTTDDAKATTLRPLSYYVYKEKVLVDVWVRPYCGDKDIHDALTRFMEAAENFKQYSFGFHETMMERLLPSTLPVHWPFRMDRLRFCSEWLMKALREVGVVSRWAYASPEAPDHDLQYWLPADMEPGRRLDRLLPGVWSDAVRVRRATGGTV